MTEQTRAGSLLAKANIDEAASMKSDLGNITKSHKFAYNELEAVSERYDEVRKSLNNRQNLSSKKEEKSLEAELKVLTEKKDALKLVVDGLAEIFDLY